MLFTWLKISGQPEAHGIFVKAAKEKCSSGGVPSGPSARFSANFLVGASLSNWNPIYKAFNFKLSHH